MEIEAKIAFTVALVALLPNFSHPAPNISFAIATALRICVAISLAFGMWRLWTA